MKKIILFYLNLLIGSIPLYGQDYIVEGRIQDTENQPIEFANVTLHRLEDSSLVKGTLTDQSGDFQMTIHQASTYFLKASYIGYETVFTTSFSLFNGKKDIGLLLLPKTAINLEGITVTSQKPFIERQLDKLIVNVDNSIISAGASALEVLEQSPNVFIDPNDNITLKGKTGVIIQIDSKQVRLSGPELSNLLRGTTANAIEKIEIISNPSARYDAEGSAGIINIKMKRDKRHGTNGSATFSYGRGRYGKASTGVNLNYRDKYWNVYTNYNYSWRRYFTDIFINRRFVESNQSVTILDQENNQIIPYNTHTPRVGIDFMPTSKTIIGFLASGHHNQFNTTGKSQTQVLNIENDPIGRFATNNASKDKWSNYALNLNLRHQIDSTGKTLSADFDYARYWNEADQLFTSEFIDVENIFINQNYLRGDIDGFLNLYTVKVDYNQSLGKKGKLEAGAKSSFVKTDNDLKYFILENEQELLDNRQSNHFIYQENINAGYLNWGTTFGEWNMQLGLRGEQTIAEGQQITTDSTFNRKYFQLFPSAFLNYAASKNHLWGVSLSRRINRPNYQQLNPFRSFVDPTTFREGNPFLQPQLTYSVELTHTFKQRYNTTLSYSITDNNITSVFLQNNEQKATIVSIINLAQLESVSLNLNAPLTITKWWTGNINLNIFKNHYKGVVAGFDLLMSNPLSFSLNTINAFQLGNGFSAEIGGFYVHNNRLTITDIQPIWQLTAGIQKSLWNRKGILRLNIRDIFWTGFPRGKTQFGNINQTYTSYRETRIGTLSFTYHFGKNTVQGARRRQTGATEEKRRAARQG